MNAVRGCTLLSMGLLHMALLVFWPRLSMPAADSARRETEITFVKVLAPPMRLAPQPKALPPQPKALLPLRAAALPAPTKPPPRLPRESTVVAIPEQVQPTPVEPQPEAALSRDNVMAQALADVGKLDREARQSSLNMADRKLVLAPSRRERLIGDAFIARGPTRIVEEVMPDGRRRSRRGNMCAYMESNVLMGGRDVIRDGVKTRWEQCPS